MGELFKNFIHSSVEKGPRFIYDSGGVAVNRFEDSKIPRPSSRALQEAHPDLYAFLMKKEQPKNFKVGIVHIDGNGAISRGLAESGKTPIEIVFALREMFRSGLLDLAKKMKEDPSSELGQLEFLTAFSRFASERIARELGFEVFEIDEEDETKYRSASHKHTKKTYEILSKKGTVKNPDSVKTRPAKIALISRQGLLALLENTPKQ
jgi:hypothetical protein